MIDDPRGAFTCPSQHSQFWPILARFVDYYSPFWGPKVISMLLKPKVRLRVGHQHSQFGPILARFVDYYSLFWGPEVISMIDDPCGAYVVNTHSFGRFSPVS